MVNCNNYTLINIFYSLSQVLKVIYWHLGPALQMHAEGRNVKFDRVDIIPEE